MNVVFKILVFSIMLNFAVGLMMTAIPAFGNDPSNRAGLDYDAGFTDDFTTDMEKEILPTGNLEDKGDAIYRVLDMMNLGFIKKFLDVIDKYVFGFISMLDAILGRHLESGLRSLLFGGMKTLMTVGYIFGAFWLWTGKELNKQTG